MTMCPHCNQDKGVVAESRLFGSAQYRRRQCRNCHKRFTTCEYADPKFEDDYKEAERQRSATRRADRDVPESKPEPFKNIDTSVFSVFR